MEMEAEYSCREMRKWGKVCVGGELERVVGNSKSGWLLCNCNGLSCSFLGYLPRIVDVPGRTKGSCRRTIVKLAEGRKSLSLDVLHFRIWAVPLVTSQQPGTDFQSVTCFFRFICCDPSKSEQ